VTPNRTGTRLLIGAYSNGIDSPYITSAGGTIIVDHLPCGGYFNGDTAFDPGTEDFFVANGGNVCVFTQKGEMVGTFGGGTLGGAQGIAVNATSGAVYVEDNNRIAVFVPRVVPDVTTGPATEIDHTSATLNGQVAPDPEGGGEVESCHFDIGTDTSYGTEVPCIETTPYGGPTQVTADVSGLSMETTYHYRLVAANSVDSTAGQDMTFTPRAVLGLSTDDASDITPVSATLNGAFDPNNEETHYYFEWGPDSSYGNSTPLTLGWSTGDPAGPTAAAAQIGGLSSFTKYHYRVVAENGVGTSYGEDHTLTTAPPAPPEITESAASEVDNDSATISAAVNPGYGTTYYSFEYGTDTSYGTEVPGTETLGPDDAEDHPIATALTGLQPGTTYHFRVVATNFGGTSHGPDVTFTTLDAPTIGLEGSENVTQTSATLTADINPGRSATSFHFEYGPTAEYGSSTRESATIGSDGISHSVLVQLSGLQPGTTYHFRAVAKNGIGARAGDDHIFTTAPAPTTERPAPKKCRAAYFRRHGHCVKKHRKRRHHRGHGHGGNR
jgi:phosphodiesterase/alkaline phosphatase D-like protein